MKGFFQNYPHKQGCSSIQVNVRVVCVRARVMSDVCVCVCIFCMWCEECIVLCGCEGHVGVVDEYMDGV